MSPVVFIEVVHATLMCLFVCTLPLLFWHRWPKWTLAVACFDVVYVLVNRLSHHFLGECIFTRLARWAGGEWNEEWFTVKFCRRVFGLIPTNQQVTYVEQALIVLTALGVFLVWWRRR